MPAPHIDFFISRSGDDVAIARRINEILLAAGYTTAIQDQDFGHRNFMAAMDEALTSGARVIALLSQRYLESDNCMAEAYAALAGDVLNRNQRLIPLRVTDCRPAGLLANIAWLDLVAIRTTGDGKALEDAVLAAVKPGAQQQTGPHQDLWIAPRQLLHPDIRPAPHFTGREAELARLRDLLFSGGQAAVTGDTRARAISGLGGIGKSTLAIAYALANRDAYGGLWLIRSETRESLLDGLISLGGYLIPGLGEEQDRVQAAHKALRALSANATGKPWLLIYDNVGHPDDLVGFTPQTGAHVLITSRWEDWPQGKLSLGLFDRPQSVAFLQTRAEREDPAGADRLADFLGDLPLALEQAASYCRGAAVSFDDYIANAQSLLNKKSRAAGAYPDSVWATFSLALDRAIDRAPEAERFMGILAFLAPDDIPLDLFTDEVMAPIERGEAVAELSSVSLIERGKLADGTFSVSVHRLVQAVMQDRLGEGGGSALAQALKLLVNAFPFDADDVRNWPACERLASHARTVLAAGPEAGPSAADTSWLLNQLALYRLARAEYADAEPLMRRALAIDEKSFGPDHPTVALRLNNLAQLLKAANRLAEAEPLMRRALAIDEKSYGPDHPEVAIRLNNLSELLRATDRLADAEPLMRRALAIDEKSYGPDHPDVAIDLNNLAQLLQDTNRLADAEPLMRRALAIDEKSFHPDHPSVARDLNNLAQLLKDTNRLADAEPLMRRALAIDEKSLGSDHPSVAIRLNNLAQLLNATNRLAQAEPLAARSLRIFENSLPKGHPDIATVRNNLDAIRAQLAAGGAPASATVDPTAAAPPLQTSGPQTPPPLELPRIAPRPPRRSLLDRLLGRK